MTYACLAKGGGGWDRSQFMWTDTLRSCAFKKGLTWGLITFFNILQAFMYEKCTQVVIFPQNRHWLVVHIFPPKSTKIPFILVGDLLNFQIMQIAHSVASSNQVKCHPLGLQMTLVNISRSKKFQRDHLVAVQISLRPGGQR